MSCENALRAVFFATTEDASLFESSTCWHRPPEPGPHVPSPALLDLVWAALLCEHEGAVGALDAHLEELNGSTGATPVSPVTPASPTPCKHLAACCACIEEVAARTLELPLLPRRDRQAMPIDGIPLGSQAR